MSSEQAFAAWARLVVRLRWPVIALALIGSAGLAAQLPDMRMDNTTQGFLLPDDPDLLFYDEFRRRFGRDELIVLAIEPPRVFDLEFLRWLRALHEDLEAEVPYVAEITSLVNARSTRGAQDALIVGEFLEDWPETPEEAARLEARALANPLYANLLLSEDARFTAVLLKPDVYLADDDDLDALLAPADAADGGDERYLGDAENGALVEAIQRVVARHASPDYPTYLAGTPVFTERLNRTMQRDITRFLFASTGTICLLLFALFRRASGVVLPLLIVLLSLTSTLGIMVLLDIPLSVITQILPPFLITVGVCDSVHILTIVYQRLAAGDDRHGAIVYALGHSGLAVLMTSVTTAAGLLSFATATLAPIAYLGVLAPIGVLLAFAYTAVLLPALLAVLPLRTRSGGIAGAGGARLAEALARVGDFANARPWSVIAASAVLLLAGGLGAARLHFSHDSLEWFPQGDDFRTASQRIDEALRGTSVLEVLVESGEENGLHDPDRLRRLERMGAYAETVARPPIFVGKAISLSDVVKEIHQALNENRAEFRTIPDDARLVAQELLLFENSGSDDLEDFSDSRFETGRMTLKLNWDDAVAYPAVIEELGQRFRAILGDRAEVRVTGLVALLSRTFKAVITSMGRSYVFAFAVITPLMMLLLGSVRRGLVSMIPNLAPIVVILGLMGWTGIPLDMATLLIGSIVLGLAVDDTIHFMHKFRRYFDESGDARHAIRETLRTTGCAMLFTSLILSAGFYVFTLAYMRNMVYFGVLAGTATLIAFLADVLLAPALMTLLSRRRGRTRA